MKKIVIIALLLIFSLMAIPQVLINHYFSDGLASNCYVIGFLLGEVTIITLDIIQNKEFIEIPKKAFLRLCRAIEKTNKD